MWRLEGGASGIGQADIDEEERRRKLAKSLMDAGDAAKSGFKAAQTAPADEPELLSAMRQRIAQRLNDRRRLAVRKSLI